MVKYTPPALTPGRPVREVDHSWVVTRLLAKWRAVKHLTS